jgi:VRR-NUC domain
LIPKQKDLFTRRYRQVQAPQPSEVQIQISLIARLRLQARKDVLYWHTPNGELRDKRAAAKLKAMGVLPGVSDLVFVWTENERLKILFLELKAPRRTLSEDQIAFGLAALQVGCVFECADNVDDAVSILQKHQILP